MSQARTPDFITFLCFLFSVVLQGTYTDARSSLKMKDYDTEVSAVVTKIEEGKVRNQFVYYKYIVSYQYATVDCSYKFHLNHKKHELGDSVKVFFNKQKICDAELLTNKSNISSNSNVFLLGIAFVFFTLLFLFRLIRFLRKVDWNSDVWA
jgi:hypothetical protein